MALLKLVIRGFKRDLVKAGPVTIDALKPVHYEERTVKGDPWEVVALTAEALVEKFDFLDIEAEVLEREADKPGEAEMPDRIYKGEYGGGFRGRGSKHITHRPSRLRRVGVIYVDTLERKAGEGGYYVLSRDDIEWHEVEGEYYVHEGTVEVEAGERIPVYLVLETDYGDRWLRLIPRDAPLRIPRRESG
ncbi:MAG: hypothetical protein F7B17_03330 [Desulfurococcales archaeon]|nr:hypothetical protein [Desulfurococcales archaeon]